MLLIAVYLVIVLQTCLAIHINLIFNAKRSATSTKKKCRLYSQEYLKYGFVPSFANKTIPICLLCKKTFSNGAMKPAKMKDNLERIHSYKKNKNITFQNA